MPIEELKRTHEELRKTQEALELAQASAAASEKMAALGRLVAGVSHELINSINIIHMNIYMMIHDSETPHIMVKNLQDMEEQAQRIIKITQNLLYYARKRTPERRWIDFNEIVKRTYGLVEHELRLGNIVTDLELAEGLPEILVDQDQLQQVVLNLLTNASDAMANGGRLFINTTLIHEGRMGYVEFRVEDSGPGIPLENIDRVFEPFFTTKPEDKGTGLGLSICKGILETHGGSILAENLLSGGAAFVVKLPIEQSITDDNVMR